MRSRCLRSSSPRSSAPPICASRKRKPVALAEALRSRNETADLRAALERAESAETNNRHMVERMRMANESAGLSVWQWTHRAGLTWVIDEGGPMIERCGGMRELKGTEYSDEIRASG